MRRESEALLWDVRNAGVRISGFIAHIDESAYTEDELRRSAVERQLEILGEALKNVRNADPETAKLIPDLARIIGLRNILAHAYTVVDDAVIWAAASQRVPELLRVVDQLLSSQDESQK